MKKKNDIIEEVYKKYYDSLMVIACSYTHDRHTAADLVQDTFVKAILSYRSGGSFIYWANKVLRNSFYNMMRDNKKYEEISEYKDTRAQEDILVTYIKSEEKAHLASLISNLPLKYREVMIESIYLELSDDEIASEYGYTKENVRQIRSRAVKMLKKMEDEHNEG